MIQIDGSVGEAGGQILRTAVALSAVTQKPCRIFNIRKGRPQPGLKHQHLEAIKAVQTLCDADVAGLEIGSTEITFAPGKIKSGEIKVNIPTAGSISLVLQAMMIPALHAESPVKIIFKGGATHGKWAPPINYVKSVLLPLLEKMGYKMSLIVKKYGYYPSGDAVVEVEIMPAKLAALNLIERGKLLSITGITHASLALKNASVAERQETSAAKEIKGGINIVPDITAVYTDTASLGSGVELEAVFEHTILGANALGERNKSAEKVGMEAARALLEQINSTAAVDEYAEDQLLPYMALAAPSRIRAPKITSHTRTNIWVIEKFLPVKFMIDEDEKIISVV
ncbi:MAG: RNA 3'-terminal phosphate cyclase [Candidatus Aenigmarchaeota archaeon]|nr:RNA 3'-terminal phosphate cyclase [Candidatus Aenigmarchaeota archaeon]